MAPRNIRREAEAELSVLRMENKKRKYSPIVWDRDDKVCKLSSNTGISSHHQLTNNFLSTGSFRVSTGFRQSGPPIKSVVDILSGVYVEDGVSGQYGGHKKVEYDDCAELHDIGSCRWVDDVEDGEISDSLADKGMKRVTGVMGVSKKLTSSQFVERRREGSEGKSSGSSDKGSNHSTLTDECDMEMDEQQNYGDDCAKLHDIGSCRWVDDVEDGEISDSPADKGMKRVTGEMGVSKKLTSSQFVERRREGSEGKFSGSSDKGSNHSTLTDECDMEIDEQKIYGDSSVGHLNTDCEDECGFWETPEPAAPLQRSANMFRACRNVDDFEKLRKIGEGTYGVVYKARNKITGEIVALKKVKMNNNSEEGFPLTSLREINILLSSDHPSIIDLKEVVEGSTSDCIFLVMEYMDHDLKAVMDRKKQPFCQSEVKCLMLQLLQGIKYLHDNWVLHRDLKTSNLLLNSRGELKICDLGMARQYGSPAKPYTQLVVTLWYRAPELLLGAKQYSTAVDMWSVGCIMAELLLNQPLFNGNTEISQIDKIFRMLGTPNETSWPGFSELPKAKAMFVKQPDNLLRKKFPAASFTGAPPLSNAGFDLLNKMLTCDPEKRITADAALNHRWFREFPLPKSKDCMPTF